MKLVKVFINRLAERIPLLKEMTSSCSGLNMFFNSFFAVLYNSVSLISRYSYFIFVSSRDFRLSDGSKRLDSRPRVPCGLVDGAKLERKSEFYHTTHGVFDEIPSLKWDIFSFIAVATYTIPPPSLAEVTLKLYTHNIH